MSLLSSHPDFLVLLNQVDYLSICITRFGHLPSLGDFSQIVVVFGVFFPGIFLLYIYFLMSSLRYFSLYNINLESGLSFLHPDDTTGNELNGLPLLCQKIFLPAF